MHQLSVFDFGLFLSDSLALDIFDSVAIRGDVELLLRSLLSLVFSSDWDSFLDEVLPSREVTLLVLSIFVFARPSASTFVSLTHQLLSSSFKTIDFVSLNLHYLLFFRVLAYSFSD